MLGVALVMSFWAGTGADAGPNGRGLELMGLSSKLSSWRRSSYSVVDDAMDDMTGAGGSSAVGERL